MKPITLREGIFKQLASGASETLYVRAKQAALSKVKAVADDDED